MRASGCCIPSPDDFRGTAGSARGGLHRAPPRDALIARGVSKPHQQIPVTWQWRTPSFASERYNKRCRSRSYVYDYHKLCARPYSVRDRNAGLKHQTRILSFGMVVASTYPGLTRLCGLTALLLWCAALFADGWRFALIGWLGPLFLAPGWYANIPFAINLIRCLRGLRPGIWSASIGVGLAATALMPMRVTDFVPENDGGSAPYWTDWADLAHATVLWLWLGAITLVWFAALIKPRDETARQGNSGDVSFRQR
jgi:hypothetical protein